MNCAHASIFLFAFASFGVHAERLFISDVAYWNTPHLYLCTL